MASEELTSTPDISSQTTHQQIYFKDHITSKFNLPIVKIIVILLTVQGMYGLFQSIKFIFFDFRLLETQLTSHSISQMQINSFATQAIIMVSFTILSMFFALRLALSENKTVKNIQTIIALLLVLANIWIMKNSEQLGSGNFLSDLIIKLFGFSVN